jgi:DNA-directed RNA polymerase specialized sigma24 family protein
LFTYCLSVLCDHDAATAALGEALALAERQQSKRPTGVGQQRPWLYALARWACLRGLAEQRRACGTDPAPSESGAAAAQRQRELAALAWPEAAGTSPEQREALELAVRHRLAPREVAAVLGLERDEALGVLSSAACEVERTRAALAVVERGGCPAVIRLTADRVLLGTALRRELVRHVDDCAECRRTAERATAGAPWPGSDPGTTASRPLPVLSVSRADAHAAMLRVLRTRHGSGRGGPRFDRRGYPLDPKDHAAHRRRLRSRALTTTVVATVLAAPVFALWAAHRGASLTGEVREGASLSVGEANDADEADEPGGLSGPSYQKAGHPTTDAERRFAAGDPASGAPAKADGAAGQRRARGLAGGPSSVSPAPSHVGGSRGATGRGPGRLTVQAQPRGDATLITLSASGGSAVRWSAYTDAPWLRLSVTSGVLRPGESVTITVSVDQAREPADRWTARISVDPAGAVVSIEGHGRSPESAPPESAPPDPAPSPSDPTTSPSEPDTSGRGPSDGSPPRSDTGDSPAG